MGAPREQRPEVRQVARLDERLDHVERRRVKADDGQLRLSRHLSSGASNGA
jgi:hypothetical protein